MLFLNCIVHIVENIDIHDLERISEESPYPLEIYYKIDDLHLNVFIEELS